MKLIEELKWDAKFLKENITWITATFAAGVGFITFLLQINNYINYTFLASYYNISRMFFTYDCLSDFFAALCLGLVISIIISWYYAYWHLLKNGSIFKNKMYWKSDVFVILIFSLIIFGLLRFCKLSRGVAVILSIVMQIVSHSIIELFLWLVNKGDKKTPPDLNNSFVIFKHTIKTFPIILLLCIIAMGFITISQCVTQKNYKMINSIDNSCQAIVYTTKDYYLTLNCEITNNNLTLYKGTETKITTDNVKTSKIIFENVYLKDIQKNQK